MWKLKLKVVIKVFKKVLRKFSRKKFTDFFTDQNIYHIYSNARGFSLKFGA